MPPFSYLCPELKRSGGMNDGKVSLLGMTLEELGVVARQNGLPSYAAKQLAAWIYTGHQMTIDGMTDISMKNRSKLSENYCVGRSEPVARRESVDGTVKYLFRVASGGCVETVYIPDGNRGTLCVSSQVGCKMRCLFCMTGKQGFSGQLSAADILNQIYSTPEAEGKLTNVVFMGQGEPLDNLDAVLRATEILTSSYGFGWSPKRITVSTVGIRKGLKRYLDESRCHLAVSLHNPFPEQRVQLVPAEKAYGIREIVGLLRSYDFSHQRRLSFEYTMFAGVNDTLLYAKELLRLLGGMSCRINLIRFHPVPGVALKGTEDESIFRFRDYLTRHGLFATVRASRGEDILAACGLLNTAEQLKSS